MGETTLTRCTVLLQDGPSGTAYVLGRNHRKAELMALCDALLQDRRYCGLIMLAVIKTLEEKHCKRMEAIRQRISPTKVDFFTMARGECPTRPPCIKVCPDLIGRFLTPRKLSGRC